MRALLRLSRGSLRVFFLSGGALLGRGGAKHINTCYYHPISSVMHWNVAERMARSLSLIDVILILDTGSFGGWLAGGLAGPPSQTPSQTLAAMEHVAKQKTYFIVNRDGFVIWQNSMGENGDLALRIAG